MKVRKLENIVADLMVDEDDTQSTKPYHMSSGFRNLDDIVGGFGQGELHVFGSYEGMGKTMLVLEVAKKVAEQGIPVVFFSFEDDAEKLAKRIHRTISERILLDSSNDSLSAVQETLKTLNLYFCCDAAPNHQDMADVCREVFNEEDGLIICDSLLSFGVANSSRMQPENCDQAAVEAKMLAKTTNAPVVATAPLFRKRHSKRLKSPKLTDICGTGAIEALADTITLLDRSQTYNEACDDITRPDQGILVCRNVKRVRPYDTYIASTNEILAYTPSGRLMDYIDAGAYHDDNWL